MSLHFLKYVSRAPKKKKKSLERLSLLTCFEGKSITGSSGNTYRRFFSCYMMMAFSIRILNNLNWQHFLLWCFGPVGMLTWPAMFLACKKTVSRYILHRNPFYHKTWYKLLRQAYGSAPWRYSDRINILRG